MQDYGALMQPGPAFESVGVLDTYDSPSLCDLDCHVHSSRDRLVHFAIHNLEVVSSKDEECAGIIETIFENFPTHSV